MNRILSNLRHVAMVGVLAALAATLFVTEVRSQEPLSSETPATQPPAAGMVQLNKALSAYHAGEYETAKRLLEKLREEQPHNLTCLYYLGLTYLNDGLSASRDAVGAVNKETHYSEATRSFAKARDIFEFIVERTDPRLRPIEAALDLGIAKLGSEDPSRPIDARELAQGALTTLREYTSEEPGRSDRLGHFFMGIAYYRLDRLDGDGRDYLNQAERSFEEAARLAANDPGLSRDTEAAARFGARVTYYQGLIEATRGRRNAARAKMLDVIDAASGTDLADQARVLVNYIEEEQQRSPEPLSIESPIGPLWIEGGVGMGHQYDSNVVLLGKDTELPRGIGRKDDYRFGLQADFDVSRTITHRDGLSLGRSLTFGIGGDTFHMWQPDVDDFDINSYRTRVYANWELYNDLFLGLQYDYTYTQLGHEPYISSNRLTPVFSYVWRDAKGGPEGAGEPKARTDVYYSYDYRDYFDEISRPGFDRDGAYHAVGITQTFNLWRASDVWSAYYSSAAREAADADRWLLVRFGYMYRNERTQGSEFDLFGNTVFLGTEVPLPYRLSFDFLGEFTWDSYTQPSFIDFRRHERFDFIQRYVFGLSRILVGKGENSKMPSLEVKARAGIELTFQDSNVWDRLSQDVFSYNRAVYALQLSIRF